MQAQKKLTFIGYACGIGAGNHGCADGPVVLQQSHLSITGAENNWRPLLFPIKSEDKYHVIAEINTRLAAITKEASASGEKFVVFSGDHTSAIGTFSGVASQLRSKGDMGLLWIDAHLDSHTPGTTLSGNIHGMPLAVLLGYGDDRLTQIGDNIPKIKPQNICVIGARSFEKEEQALLASLNVRIYYMNEIKKRGLDVVFAEAKKQVTQHTVGYGLSIDLDAIDSLECPAVGSPEPDGLHALALINALKQYCAKDNFLVASEIAEFNPYQDENKKSEKLIEALLLAIYGE